MVRGGAPPKPSANLVMGVVRSKMNDLGIEDVGAIRDTVPPSALAGLVELTERGTISHTVAKDVFEKMFASGRSAREIVEAEGLAQIDDESQIVTAIADVLAEERRRCRRNSPPASRTRSGSWSGRS